MNDKQNTSKILISRMALNDNKAGMKGVDKEKINKIILENTIGSKYFKNQQRHDFQVKERIKKMLQKEKLSTKKEFESALLQADQLAIGIEKTRDFSRIIMHVDMDAFYANVEELERPELKNRPMAVGTSAMLCTSNYVARRFGVRAAMPGFIAKKLCPDLIILPTNFEKYHKISCEIRKIFREYDPNFLAVSLDEAYLDITEHLIDRKQFDKDRKTFGFNEDLIPETDKKRSTETNRRFGDSPEDVGHEIRFRIHQSTRLTASAGIAPNMMLAKIGSDMNKPNGQTFIPSTRSDVLNFISDLPLRKISGIGKVSEEMLAALNIVKCKDLYEQRARIFLLFSSSSASFFLHVSLASSSNRIKNDGERKSISTERTFPDISNPKHLMIKLEELCHCLAKDLEEALLQGRTVTLKTKTSDFESHTRSRSLPSSISQFDEIFKVANELLKVELKLSNDKLSLRLMGVGLSKLETLGHVGEDGQVRINKFLKRANNPTFSITSYPASITPESGLIFSSVPSPTTPVSGPVTSVATTSVPGPVTSGAATSVPGPITSGAATSVPGPVTSGAATSVPGPVTSGAATSVPGPVKPLPSLVKPMPGLTASKSGSTTSVPGPVTPLPGSTASISGPVSPKFGLTPAAPGPTCEHQTETLTCPICRASYSRANTSLQKFNEHIDTCLNRQKIREILSEQKQTENEKRSLKRRSRKDPVASCSAKRASTLELFFNKR